MPWSRIGEVDAEAFLERCRHHGIAALLFHEIRERDEWNGWPPPIRLALEQAGKAGVAQEMLRAHHLESVLQQFNKRGIRCLLMKGEALARSHYAVPGTRARCDSDLFIDFADITAARQAITDAGLSIVSSIYKTHQFTVSRKGDRSGRVQFDVHWRILNHPRFARTISFEEAFEASLGVPGMEKIRMLDAVDALLLACMHRKGNDRHDANRLIWIYDIHALVSAMGPDELRNFATRAVELDLQEICLEGLALARVCFVSSIPAGVIELIESSAKSKARGTRFAYSNLALLADDWARLPGYEERFALLRELLLPSSAFLLHKYGKISKLWLPVLYVRQVVGGAFNRILLR